MRSACLCLLTSLAVFVPTTARGGEERIIAPNAWRVVKQKSGPVDYYSVITEDGLTFVRSRYEPPTKTAVLGYRIEDPDRQRVKKVKWRWRAQTLPVSGDECVAARADSAAAVYLTWKRGLRYYTLKYVWSSSGQKGRVCDSKRNPLVAQDTIILQSGGPLRTWMTEEIDLATEFRRHFEKGNPHAPVPDFVGIGLMSDGDQTRSPSSADFGAFVLVR